MLKNIVPETGPSTKNLQKFLTSKLCSLIGQECFESVWYQILDRVSPLQLHDLFMH